MRRPNAALSGICGLMLTSAVLVVPLTLSGGPAAGQAPAGSGAPTARAAAAPDAAVNGLASDLGISRSRARQLQIQQDQAHQLLASLSPSLSSQLAGKWFDDVTGRLTVAVDDQEAADQARSVGAEVKMVERGPRELAALRGQVRSLARAGVPGLNSYGVEDEDNVVAVHVNTTEKEAATDVFIAAVKRLGPGVRVVESTSSPQLQAGDVRPGNPWWPGSETNCSVGFGATDSSGGKHFVTAGHCTNNVSQPAYGQSGQQNRIGTSNAGGNRSVNAREGDMGVVAVTETGWNLSPSVNTWGQPAVTVSGSVEAIVGDNVCHSGNTSKWRCGEVTSVDDTVDYGGGIVVEGLTFTTACSMGGDSGGAWLVGDKATGLHSGGPAQCVSDPGRDEQSIFQPVEEALAKWDLDLVTGGGGGDVQPPTAPSNARVTATTSSSVSLAWDASTDDVGVTGYDVYSGSSVVASATGTSATVPNLRPDTPYSFTIRAKDAAGNVSSASSAVDARTKPDGGGGDTQAPTRPRNLLSTAQTDDSVTLAWDASTDDRAVTGYDVSQGESVVKSVAGSVTSVTVEGLEADTEYTFSVQARDAAGNTSKTSRPAVVRTKPADDGGGGREFTSTAPYTIRPYAPVNSPITSTATGSAASTVTVEVTAEHPCEQALEVTLVGPSGFWYTVDAWDGGFTCDPLTGTQEYSVPVSGEQAAGRWTLRVNDFGWGDTGTLKGWSIAL